uniref:Uncharacterized protein n=1 Tax=Anopheles culicifacies TaxID=139723 RepID=A0A182LW21_9DIPT
MLYYIEVPVLDYRNRKKHIATLLSCCFRLRSQRAYDSSYVAPAPDNVGHEAKAQRIVDPVLTAAVHGRQLVPDVHRGGKTPPHNHPHQPLSAGCARVRYTRPPLAVADGKYYPVLLQPSQDLLIRHQLGQIEQQHLRRFVDERYRDTGTVRPWRILVAPIVHHHDALGRVQIAQAQVQTVLDTVPLQERQLVRQYAQIMLDEVLQLHPAKMPLEGGKVTPYRVLPQPIVVHREIVFGRDQHLG